MKIDTTKNSYTAGLNSLSVAGNITLAGVVFGTLNPWWLSVALPVILLGFGVEIIEKSKPQAFNL